MSRAEFPHGLSRGVVAQEAELARLDRLLRSATRKWRSAKLTVVLLGGVAFFVAAVLVGVALDAALGLPAWGLVAVDAALLGVAGWVIMQWVGVARRAKHDARRTAVALEQHGGVEPSRLINALDLASADDAAAGRMSPTLRGLAVAQGDAAAERVDAGALIDRPARRKALRACLAALALGGGAWLAVPGVFSAVGPRLLSPMADLPAYTSLRFDVAVGPEFIHVGRPGVVEVTLSRELGSRTLPGEADVVVVGDDGQTQRSPMHRSFREGDVAPPPVVATAEQLAALPEPPTRFSLRFQRIDQPMAFYIETPDGRSATYTITPDTTPLFESLHATVTPPDYAGLAATTQRLEVHEVSVTKNVVRALRGSAITLTATSNVPVSEAQFSLGAQSRTLVFTNPDAGTTAEALFIVDQSTTASLQLVGQDGKLSFNLPIEIHALDDRAPSVEILSPEPVAFAVEGYPVPIRLVAKDDVGVASMKLHLNVAEQDVEPIEFASPSSTAQQGPPRRVNITHELDLAAMGAKPGDTIRYFATARDGLPFALGGPPNDAGQLAESSIHQIQIISQAQWEELARTQYRLDQMQAEAQAFMAQMQKLAEARADIVEQLAPLQEKLEAGEALSDMERQQMRDLQDQLDAFAQDARALADDMKERAEVPALYEFEEPFKERLKSLAEQLERQAALAEAMKDTAAPMAGDPPPPGEMSEADESGQSDEPPPSGSPTLPGVTPTQIEAFLEQAQQLMEEDEPFDDETQEEMEAFEEDLLRLELAEEMVFHAERIREVIVQQRTVETKLGELRFRDPDQLSPDEAQRLADYAEQEIEMREELEDAALMLRESAELAGPLLPNMSGSSIALTEQLDGLLVYPDMESAGEYAEALESALAHASAQVAADKLESLLSDVSNMPGQAEGDLDGALSLPKASLQNAIQQMAQARAAGAMSQMQNGQGQGQSGRSGSAGSRSNSATLIGPRSMGQAPNNAGAGRDANSPSNAANAADALDPERSEAQTLNPDSADTRGRSAIALPGVPPRYQDVAAAYFQRLADEANRHEN